MKTKISFLIFAALLAAAKLTAQVDTVPQIEWYKTTHEIMQLAITQDDSYLLTLSDGFSNPYLIRYNPETGEPIDSMVVGGNYSYFGMNKKGSLLYMCRKAEKFEDEFGNEVFANQSDTIYLLNPLTLERIVTLSDTGKFV